MLVLNVLRFARPRSGTLCVGVGVLVGVAAASPQMMSTERVHDSGPACRVESFEEAQIRPVQRGICRSTGGATGRTVAAQSPGLTTWRSAVARAAPSCDAPPSVDGAKSSTELDAATSGSANGRPRRPELAALYRRVADTLERSADLAERHAERDRNNGRADSARTELERATRAREAAQRGRALAARLE